MNKFKQLSVNRSDMCTSWDIVLKRRGTFPFLFPFSAGLNIHMMAGAKVAILDDEIEALG